MVFSSSSKMLYANRDAHYFLQRLSLQGYAIVGALPVIITDQCDKMKKVLESRSTDSDRGRLEANRLILGQDQPVLLHIFGLSDRLGVQGSRVVIKMEDITPVLKAAPQEAAPPSS